MNYDWRFSGYSYNNPTYLSLGAHLIIYLTFKLGWENLEVIQSNSLEPQLGATASVETNSNEEDMG